MSTIKRLIFALFTIFFVSWAVPAMAAIEPVFTVTTTDMPADTVFEFAINAPGTYYIDWGDGSSVQTITSTGTITHTFANGGVNTIGIAGGATGQKAYLASVISFAGNKNVASLGGSLGALFPTVGENAPAFKGAFQNCTNLTTIPSTLFSGVTKSAKNQFYTVFMGCTALTAIPAGLFADLDDDAAYWQFGYLFQNCKGLTGGIPNGLFAGAKGNMGYAMFRSTFEGCSGLTGSIPGDLFGGLDGAVSELGFAHTFGNCSGLTGEIPGNLFAGVSGDVQAKSFSGTFDGCSGLDGEIPGNLFSTITGAPQELSFNHTFSDCSGLTGEIPGTLFSTFTGAPQAYSFLGTFSYCKSLTGPVPATLFASLDSTGYTSGPMSNIFNNTGLATSCPAGTYQYMTGFEVDFNGKVACAPCPDNGESIQWENSSATLCFKSENFEDMTGRGIIKNYYNETTNSYEPGVREYTQCNANYYLNNASCTACPAYSHSDIGATVCTCDEGYYGDGTTCSECPANSHRDVGTTECTCNDGYSADGLTVDNTVAPESGCVQVKTFCANYWPSVSGPSGPPPVDQCGLLYGQNNTLFTADDISSYIPDGYVFSHWADRSDATITFAPGQEVQMLGSLDLRAVYTCAKDYYSNGTTCTACPDNSYSNGGDTPTCTCDDGYSLNGYVTDPDRETTTQDCKIMKYSIWYWMPPKSGPPDIYVHEYMPYTQHVNLLTSDQAKEKVSSQWPGEGYKIKKWVEYKWDESIGFLPTDIKFDPGQLVTVDDLREGQSSMELVAEFECVDGYRMVDNVCEPCPDGECFPLRPMPPNCGENSSPNDERTECVCNAGYAQDTITGTCIEKTYTITYDDSTVDSFNHFGSYTIRTPDARDGYVFEYWVDNNGTQYTAGQTISGSDLTDTVITLTGVWHCAARYYDDGTTCKACPEHSHSDVGATACTCDDGYSLDGFVTDPLDQETTTTDCQIRRYGVAYWINRSGSPDTSTGYIPHNETFVLLTAEEGKTISENRGTWPGEGYIIEKWQDRNSKVSFLPGKQVDKNDVPTGHIYLQLVAVFGCAAGYYADGNNCLPCNAGEYCPGDGKSYACPTGYTSDDKATQKSECYLTTTAGSWVDNAYAQQAPCPGNSYCTGDVQVYYGGTGGATTCPPEHPYSKIGSDEEDDCYKNCEEAKVENGKADPEALTVHHPNECAYSTWTSDAGNPCNIITKDDGKMFCYESNCPYDQEMKTPGVCTPCNVAHAEDYLDNGSNCMVKTCDDDRYMPYLNECLEKEKQCTAEHATEAYRYWDEKYLAYGPCLVKECAENYHIDANACESDISPCYIKDGVGERKWNGTEWQECQIVQCKPGFRPDANETACKRCENYLDEKGKVAVSGYISECEIASCMYQGEKYILEKEKNECSLICTDVDNDGTGSRHWNEETQKCERTCNEGFLPW